MKFFKTITTLLFLLTVGVYTSCSSDDSDVAPLSPDTEGNTELVVDLGLSVKWATCNLGANSPEQIGDYYAWGETTTKDEYTETNYFDANYSAFTLSRKTKICGTEWDVAYVKLGKNWRMPTTEEIRELVNNCTWTEETMNGVHGMRGTASNGNSIFLPITGMFAGNAVQSASQGCYWGGELHADNTRSSKYASMLTFFKGNEIHASNYYRFEGMAIRPVYVGKGIEDDDANDNPADDNQDTPPSDNIEDNLPAEAKQFIGYWLNPDQYKSDVRPHLYCSADGICFVASIYLDKNWNPETGFTWKPTLAQDYWTYDNDTKNLTAGSFIFTVTLSNQWAWKGIYKKKDKTYNESFNKASNLDVAQFLIGRVGNWLSEDNTVVDLKGYTISEDENEDDYTFNYQKGNEKGTLIIKNPFYLSKISLTFTGTINKTFHRDWI